MTDLKKKKKIHALSSHTICTFEQKKKKMNFIFSIWSYIVPHIFVYLVFYEQEEISIIYKDWVRRSTACPGESLR